MIGTNGGGFFNVNSAYPFENPNGLSNFVQILFLMMIPAALTYTYGRMIGSRRQGWTIFAVMMALFVVSVAVVYVAEQHGTPAQHLAGVNTHHRRLDRRQPGGQGAALRHRRLRPLQRGHDGRVVRRGELGLRVAHRHRRPRAVREPRLLGERVRGRRHRHVHDAAVRPARGVHRRADGGPHARVPGQEDRGARDQAGRARA